MCPKYLRTLTRSVHFWEELNFPDKPKTKQPPLDTYLFLRMKCFYLKLGLGYFTQTKDLDKRIFPKLSVLNFKSIKRFNLLSMLKFSLSYRHQAPKILYVNK